MHFTNDLLFFLTFIASVTLLVVMQQRRLIRRLLLFFVLLLFYVLRSAVLIGATKVFDRATYVELASFMSLADLGLQLALAYSLVDSLTRMENLERSGRSRDSAWFVFSAAVLVAGALTFALVSALPVYSSVPLDRGVVFSGLVFLLLLFLRNRDAGSPEAAVLTGFGVVSAANILSQYGRTVAAAHRDPRLFVAWAYANAAVWICVLVFWVLRLRQSENPLDVSELAGSRTPSELNSL